MSMKSWLFSCKSNTRKFNVKSVTQATIFSASQKQEKSKTDKRKRYAGNCEHSSCRHETFRCETLLKIFRIGSDPKIVFSYLSVSRLTVLSDCWGKHQRHRSGDGEVRPQIRGGEGCGYRNLAPTLQWLPSLSSLSALCLCGYNSSCICTFSQVSVDLCLCMPLLHGGVLFQRRDPPQLRGRWNLASCFSCDCFKVFIWKAGEQDPRGWWEAEGFMK